MTTRTQRSLYHSTRAIASGALAAVALLAAAGLSGHGVAPAHAANRPGTPTGVRAWAQDPTATRPPSIRVQWTNTATEGVCFEFNVTLNGAPTNLDAGCVNHGLGASDYVFENLQPDATYCFQVRARDWNGGDPQDGLVSDLWSAAACATTAQDVPPAPLFHPGSTTVQTNLLDPAAQTSGPSYSSTIAGSLNLAGTAPTPSPLPRPH
jgi:hypothetical protein